MRVLVCGGREYSDWDLLSSKLNSFHNAFVITVLIEGEAPGADSMAAMWARNNGVTVAAFPADWERYGKAAGPIRNKQMLDEGKPETVIAFFDRPYEESRGTKNMCEQARKAGLPIIRYDENGNLFIPDEGLFSAF